MTGGVYSVGFVVALMVGWLVNGTTGALWVTLLYPAVVVGLVLTGCALYVAAAVVVVVVATVVGVTRGLASDAVTGTGALLIVGCLLVLALTGDWLLVSGLLVGVLVAWLSRLRRDERARLTREQMHLESLR